MNDYYLKCISCNRIYTPNKDLYFCEECGAIMGTLEVIYDYDNLKIKKNFSKKLGLNQFRDLLPVDFNTEIDDFIGGTPLIKFKDKFKLKEVMIKYDGMSISGSYKDRASIIAINKAIEYGYNTIFCASTGNAASSLALLSAHTNLKTYIFVPNSIPEGKLAQLMVAGCEVVPIEATYDEVFDISMEIGFKKGWYCRNSAINPYLLEGKKTGAYEIIVQNDYIVPDYCFVAVGDGTVVSSICKGFMEFAKLGLIDKIPKIIGVQAEGASIVKKVFEKGKPYMPIVEKVNTIADSICVGNPRDVIKACVFMDMVDGEFVSVSDEEIVSGIIELASTTGIFAEPAGAITLAGLNKMIKHGKISGNDSVCLIITGNGLKDITAVKGITKVKTYSKDEVYKIFEGGL